MVLPLVRYYTNYADYSIYSHYGNYVNFTHISVVPDDDNDDLGRISEEEDPQPPSSLTPPSPPVHAQPSPSLPRPIRQRAMAQLRPVSIPNIVSDIAGPDPSRRISDFDRHYMPDGRPAAG
jgi:hypothetical protein